jgi:ADP-ribose pyrophosphatase YjhB (NUDIX family)
MGYVEELRALVGHRPLILVGAVAVIVDKMGRLLLEERKYPKNKWGLAGGLMELGESTEDVARREVLEETGLVVDQLHLINVYSGPNHFAVAENGDEFYTVTAAYYTTDYKGELAVDETESISFKFFYPNELPENMVGSHRAVIEDYLAKHYPFKEPANR